MQEIPKTQNIKTLYEQLPPKIIVSIKSWNYVHNLIGPYAKYIIQQYPGGTIVNKYVSLTCTTMINIPLLQSHWILTESMKGRISLSMDPPFMEELGRSNKTFSKVMSPPLTSQRIQPLTSFNFNLILTISPTTLSSSSI